MPRPAPAANLIPQNSAGRVGVILVTYNGERMVRQCLESLAAQTFTDFSLLIIDNGSTDDTIATIEKDWPTIKLIQRRENLGFTKAYNHGLAWCRRADYVLCLNQDAFLEPGYLQELVNFLDQHPSTGSASGMLLRYDLAADEATQIIDSLGLVIRRTHRVFNIAEGKIYDHQLTVPTEVFGLSATAVMYRTAALETVALRRAGRAEYFDEDFFAYKEDIDLAWRLRLAGYKSFMVPTAVAYHVRSVRPAGRQNRRPVIKQLSYRNHWLVILADEPLINLIIFFPWIAWLELGKFIYSLFLEPATIINGWAGIFRLLPHTLAKRRFIQKNKKIKAKEIRAWLH